MAVEKTLVRPHHVFQHVNTQRKGVTRAIPCTLFPLALDVIVLALSLLDRDPL